MDDAPSLQPVPPGGGHKQSSLPFGATLNPLQVHLVSKTPRPPTMAEVEVIMNYLQTVNDRQSHEVYTVQHNYYVRYEIVQCSDHSNFCDYIYLFQLNRMKSDLKDVLYSHKWTPDAYLLARAYVGDDKPYEGGTANKLPHIPRPPTTRKM